MCGCVTTNKKEVKNSRGITNTRGGVQLGGGDNANSPEDVAAARAAKFEAKRDKNKNRGLTKESKIEYDMRQKRLEDAEKYKAQREGDPNLQWGGK